MRRSALIPLVVAIAGCTSASSPALSAASSPVVLASAAATQALSPANAFGARIVSPAPGSTLPSGAVTFMWTDEHADYFLTIESVTGAHDIFFAFVPATSLTLGPACAAAPPTGCIPARGETIHLKLMTKLHGVWNSGFEYTYTAAGA